MVESNFRLNQTPNLGNLTVSAVIPSFNAGEYITEAINSVLAQTYRLLEIIVVDDGSQDNTKEVLKPFIEAQKIRYFYQENQGPGVARNLGLSKTLGDLVAFCDADDVWLPEKLERQVVLFNNPQTSLVYADMEIMGGSQTGAKYSEINKIKSFFRGNAFSELVKQNFIQTSTVVARRRVLEDCGGFSRDNKFFSVEDYVLWLMVAKNHRLDYLQEVLARHRIHDANISLQDKKQAYQRLADVYAYLIYKYGPLPIVLWKYFETRLKGLLS